MRFLAIELLWCNVNGCFSLHHTRDSMVQCLRFTPAVASASSPHCPKSIKCILTSCFLQLSSKVNIRIHQIYVKPKCNWHGDDFNYSSVKSRSSEMLPCSWECKQNKAQMQNKSFISIHRTPFFCCTHLLPGTSNREGTGWHRNNSSVLNDVDEKGDQRSPPALRGAASLFRVHTSSAVLI